MYVVAVVAAIAICSRRWRQAGGDPALVREVALWGFPAGLIGGRLYFLATSWNEVPHHWWGSFAIWRGGLGIWGGIAAGTLVGLVVLRRRGGDIPRFLDAAAPALLAASAITSTKSCSAARPRCPGDSRSILPIDRTATPRTPPSTRPSCTRSSGTSGSPARWFGWATTDASDRLACSRSTSPATRLGASPRSCCGSTPPTTCSGSA